MRQVSIWQLANDPEAYGEDAGKFILTRPDGEDEVAQGLAMFNPFGTADEAQAYATAHGWEVVPLTTND